jgi:hypothetical protein
MRERLVWQKRSRFRGRALDLMYIKLFAGTLIVHKTPSKFAPYEFELRFKPIIFLQRPFLTFFLKKQPCCSRKLTFQNNFVIEVPKNSSLLVSLSQNYPY